MAPMVSYANSNDKFNFATDNIFEINVGPPNMQGIIIPNAVFARD